MSKTSASPIAILFLVSACLACANSSDNRNVTVTPGNTNSLTAVRSPNLSPEKGKEEKSFSFTAQSGKNITVDVYADPEKSGGKMVIFTPFLAKTDGDLYNASLNTLWSVYGKKRGTFQLADAKTEFDSGLGGNIICWDVSNPTEQFCVFPIKDSGSGEIATLRVWLK